MREDVTIEEALKLKFYSEIFEYEITIEDYLKKILKNVWLAGEPIVTKQSKLDQVFSTTKQFINDLSSVRIFDHNDITACRKELLQALLHFDLLPDHCIETKDNVDYIDPTNVYANRIVTTLISFM